MSGIKNHIVILFFGIFSFIQLSGQNNYSLSGQILNENKEALPGASVLLQPGFEGTTTNAMVNYTISDLPEGLYIIEISLYSYIVHLL